MAENKKWFAILKDNLPKGLLFELIPDSDHEAVFRAMSKELGRLDAFMISVRDESNPETIDQLLNEWVEIYNINPNLSDVDKKAAILSYYTAIGNQALNYLQTQINKLNFGAIVIEFIDFSSHCGIAITGVAQCGQTHTTLRVIGTFTSDQLSQIQELIEYYKPAHVEVIYDSTFTFIPARVGLAQVGATKIGTGAL